MYNKLTRDELQPWQHIIECLDCGEQIHSRYSGQFVSCSCGAIYIDSTPYYSRYGGGSKIKHIKPVENE
jgi:hypothetical protein